MTIVLTSEEIDEQHQRALAVLAPQMAQPVAPLFHYARAQGLMGIVKTHQMWATRITYLNDAEEVLYAIKLFRQAVMQRLGAKVTEEIAFLLNRLDEATFEPRLETLRAFVVCFSAAANDLSQWRAYGGEHGGFMIEFDSDALKSRALQLGALLLPVVYDPSEQTAKIHHLLRLTEKFFLKGLNARPGVDREKWLKVFLENWLLQMGYVAAFIKHPAFEAEDEWRLIYQGQPPDQPRMQYTERGSLLVGHIPLSLGTPDPTDAEAVPRLPIKSITTGPGIHRYLSMATVGDLLGTNGYFGIRISATETPYRSG